MGNMVSGLVGGVLKAVGLEKIAPFVSLAVNAFTGNWAGVAMDVAGLASRIAPNSGFAKFVSKAAPIASAFMGSGGAGGGIGNLLSGSRLGELAGGFNNLTSGFKALEGGDIFAGGKKILDAFKTAKSFVDDLNSFNIRSADAHRQLGFGNIFTSEATE
jgi:hypothetical protein